jgi:hypothetical protein
MSKAKTRAPREAGGLPAGFELRADVSGALWDLLLYVPTVGALASIGVKLWFSGEQGYAYLLSFLASFFFIVGANRILRTRLMLLPSAPTAIELGEEGASIRLRSGARAELVKQPKVYADVADRSFGVSGLDREGRRLQFVFHRGQFAAPQEFAAARAALQRLQAAAARAA